MIGRTVTEATAKLLTFFAYLKNTELNSGQADINTKKKN